jgi:hypothetical protein
MNSKNQDSRLSPRFPTRYQPPIASAHSVVETHGKPAGHLDLSSSLKSRNRPSSSPPQRLQAALQNMTAPPTFVINNNGGHISMGAVLSTNSAPLDKINSPNAAPPAAAVLPPTSAASLPANDLRRSIKRKYEPLEIVSTTALPGILPRPTPLSSSKKRNLRAARHRLELRRQAHAASAQINALSTHTDKLDRLIEAVDRAAQPPSSPIPASAGAPPPAYQPAAAPLAWTPRPNRPPGELDYFLYHTATGSSSSPPAFGPLRDDHYLLRQHDPLDPPAGQQRHPPHLRRAPIDGASPFPLASPSPLGSSFSPNTPSTSPPMRPAPLNALGAHVLLARRDWHDSFHFRPRAPDRASRTPPRFSSAPFKHRPLEHCAAHHDRPGLPPPSVGSPQLDSDTGSPPPPVSAPPERPEPRLPYNSLDDAHELWPRPPGPALAAAQRRLQETVRLHYPDINLLHHYGGTQPPAASTDAAVPSPPATGETPPAPSLPPGTTTAPEPPPDAGPLLPSSSDPLDPGTAAAPRDHDANEPPSLTPTEELLPGYREESRHDSPRLDEIHPTLPTSTAEHSPPPVNRARPSCRLHLERRPHTPSSTIGSRLAGSKRRIRGRETDSAAGSSGSDSPPDRRSPFRDFRLSPPPSQRHPASSQAAQPPRVTRSSAREPPPLPKLKWRALPTRRATPGPGT